MNIPRAFGIGLLFLVTGCAAWRKSPKPPARPISVMWSAYAGTTLGAPTTQAVATDGGWRLDTTLLALPTDPGQVLQPLSAQSRLFTQPTAGDPVLASPLLTQSVRVGADDAARHWFNALQDPAENLNVGVQTSSGVLAEGLTLAVVIGEATPQAEVRLHRQGDRLQLLIAQQYAGGDSQSTNREMLLADGLVITPEQPLILVIPIALPDSGVKAIAARFDFSLPSADESFLAAAQRTDQLLRQSDADVSALPTALPTGNDAWSGYELVLRNVDAPEKRRAAMNFVAAQTQANIAQDLILVADGPTLAELHKTVVDSMQTLDRKSVLLGWLMDYAAIKLCADRAAAGTVSPQMISVLTVHLGEAGRNTASLAELIKGVKSREEFQTRVVVENMIYLEDSSPAARVRAFDFLTSRGKAPAGYDPLGPLSQRRAALDAAMNAATQPTGVNP